MMPAPLERCLNYDYYDNPDSDFTSSKLSKPPQVVRLEKENWQAIKAAKTPDDAYPALKGQIVHHILEQHALETDIVEQRYHAQLSDFSLSGQVDRFDTISKELSDYKTCSVGKMLVELDKGPNADNVAQININRLLMKINGIEVDSLALVYIALDWSKIQAAKKPGYPETWWCQIDVPMWSDDEALLYIRERAAVHRAKSAANCTNADTWANDQWKVLKKGGKKAIAGGGRFETREQALAFLESQDEPENHMLVNKIGEPTRCLYYCGAKPYCEQFKAMGLEE